MQYLVEGPFADPAVLDAVLGMGGYVLEPRDSPAPNWPCGTLALPAEAEEPFAFYLEAHGLMAEPGAESRQAALDLSRAVIAGRRFHGEMWTPRWREIWIDAVPEILSYRGDRPAAEVTLLLNMVWARADSRLRARDTPRVARSGFQSADVTIHEQSRAYAKYFTLEDYVYSHPHFDGGQSAKLPRAVFIAADAVTVLPYDPVRDRVLLIEQVRAAPLARGDRGVWLMETVAGRIEPGDTPEFTAFKETREEAGLELSSLHKVAEYYPSTGAFSEYLYAYIGIADLPDGVAQLGGVDTEGEDIRGHLMEREQMMAAIARGEMPVGPLILSAFWLHANRHLLGAAG